ncbi:hypothetical protein niasHS_002915 [Heterodera schachtii]|uniref:Uncharacterized protein n=1 Tax=Heterodera schachtii TaxID=97005 RepID=A0ABD2K9V3_HETSC
MAETNMDKLANGAPPPVKDGRYTKSLIFATLAIVVFGSVFQFGFHIGATNNKMTGHQFLVGAVASCFTLGRMIGGVSVGTVTDKFGRRKPLLFNNFLAAIAAVLLMFSTVTGTNYFLLYIGHFTIGLTSGLNSGLAPMYLMELSPANLRGSLGSFPQLFVTIAILVSQLIGLPGVLGDADKWNYTVAFTFVLVTLQLCTLLIDNIRPMIVQLYRLQMDNIRQVMREEFERFDGARGIGRPPCPPPPPPPSLLKKQQNPKCSPIRWNTMMQQIRNKPKLNHRSIRKRKVQQQTKPVADPSSLDFSAKMGIFKQKLGEPPAEAHNQRKSSAYSAALLLSLLAISYCNGAGATKSDPPLISDNSFAKAFKPLRIAIIAPLHQSVPPKPGKYSEKNRTLITPKHEFDNDAERVAKIVNELVEGLVARGHQVTLFASPDSNTSAHLITDASYGAFRHKRVVPGIFNHAYRWMFEQVRRRADKFDILHFHTFEHLPHIDDFVAKTVTTLYDQPADGKVTEMNPLAELFPNVPIVVRDELKEQVSAHWKNVIGTINEDGSEDLTAQYEQIYEKVLGKQHKTEWENVQQKVKKADKYKLCKKSVSGQKLKILVVSSPIFDTLPPKKAGGTEIMIYALTESLVKLGHDVTLLALSGSETSAKLFEIPFKTNPWACKDNWVKCQLPVIYNQEMVKRHAHEYDIIHVHDPSNFIEFRHFLNHAVHTRHMPVDDTVFFGLFSDVPHISISEEQQRLTPIVLDLNWVGSVHNGINLDDFKFVEVPKQQQQPYLAWMGRMIPDKGVDVAIKFAIEAGMKLKIAAQIVDDHRKWWEKRILPLINEKHANLIEYVGEIGPEQRNDFLGNATAFLFTPKWDEPFGLGMIEAMATGTPVIAIQRGAVGEIVIDDVNGVSFDYEDNQMIFDFINVKQLVARVSKLNRAKIRQIVEQRWSLEQMSKNYVKVYRKLLRENCL